MTSKIQRKRVSSGILGFLLAAALFSGCGEGEKKGQKEYEEGMNFYTVQQYESAVKQFATAANLGHAEAQNQLGLCFAKGEGVKQDDAEAVKWFRKAAEQGFAESQYTLGCAYYSGKGGLPIDLEEAVKWFRKAAEQGIAESQYMLGCAYNEGKGGLPVDLEEAAKWLEKAAKQGNTKAQKVLDPIKKVIKLITSAKKGDTDAMFALGVALYNGDGVKENKTEAVKWFQKAAEKGDATAMYNLFICYAKGNGVEQDMQEAIRWGINAGDHGDAKAYYMVGLTYFFGDDIQIDLSEAVKWLSKAVDHGYPKALEAEVDLSLGWVKQTLEKAEKGDIGAMRALSHEYKKHSSSSFPLNSRESDKWMNQIRQAASSGNAKAMEALGSYESGTVERIVWFRKAFEAWEKNANNESSDDYVNSMYQLGVYYELGIGVDKDLAEAVKWYKKAAEKGNTDAMCSLGSSYRIGHGVDKDPAEAVKWYKKAAEKGNTHAMCNLGSCYHFGDGVDEDPAESVKWYKKAAEKGNTDAMYELGVHYENNKDIKEARKWYRQAAVFGNSSAKNSLKKLDGKQ